MIQIIFTPFFSPFNILRKKGKFHAWVVLSSILSSDRLFGSKTISTFNKFQSIAYTILYIQNCVNQFLIYYSFCCMLICIHNTQNYKFHKLSDETSNYHGNFRLSPDNIIPLPLYKQHQKTNRVGEISQN